MKEPITCREIRPMPLETRRALLDRQAWINNVKRVLGMTDKEAQDAWSKIKSSANYPS